MQPLSVQGAEEYNSSRKLLQQESMKSNRSSIYQLKQPSEPIKLKISPLDNEEVSKKIEN